MKKSQKKLLQQHRQDEIKRKENEDANGIMRKRQREATSFLTPKKLIAFKIMLIALLPIVFFLYSPLLLPICIVYALLYFPAKKLEKSMNFRMKKSLCVTVPKFDCVIAALVICVAVFGSVISAVTSSTQPSEFAGKSQSQIEEILTSRGATYSEAKSAAEVVVETGVNLTEPQKYTLQALTIYTGHRELFATKNKSTFGFNNNLSGSSSNSGSSGSAPHEDCPFHQVGSETGLNLGEPPCLQDVPITGIFSQIITVVSIVILISMIGAGIYVIVKMKNMNNDKPDKPSSNFKTVKSYGR